MWEYLSRRAAGFTGAREAPVLLNHLVPVAAQVVGRAVVDEAGCDGSPLGYCP
jgi:hypothetical protein